MVTAEEEVCSSLCSSLGMLQSSPGKSCADIYQINKASRGVSGLYWINTTSVPQQVNCDMELECGGHKGGWTTIVKFDAKKESCPSGWTATNPLLCRSGSDASGCYSAIFTTYNMPFNKVCGQVKGYQKGTPSAFYSSKYDTKSINDHYVDGLSITYGNPHKHVWTYAVGCSMTYHYPNYNCPCSASPGPDPPAFVGNHYYCGSGHLGIPQDYTFSLSHPLWDGNGCYHAENNCCTNPDMPWFFKQFAHPMRAYLEARICRRDTFDSDDTLVERIELYIQ